MRACALEPLTVTACSSNLFLSSLASAYFACSLLFFSLLVSSPTCPSPCSISTYYCQVNSSASELPPLWLVFSRVHPLFFYCAQKAKVSFVGECYRLKPLVHFTFPLPPSPPLFHSLWPYFDFANHRCTLTYSLKLQLLLTKCT